MRGDQFSIKKKSAEPLHRKGDGGNEFLIKFFGFIKFLGLHRIENFYLKINGFNARNHPIASGTQIVGKFESGATAAMFGPVASVVMGGVGAKIGRAHV